LKNISESIADKYIGVVGSGSFGTAIANLLATKNKRILLYVRDAEKLQKIIHTRESAGQQLSDNIKLTGNLEELGKECDVIFPIVPSAVFRETMQRFSFYLKPYHILIHGTKGFDLNVDTEKLGDSKLPIARKDVRTMSEVIREETSVIRVGCLAGPNLSHEIAENKPAATVIASHFDEVINTGQRLLKNERFLVYGSNDLKGTELCGILKNIYAIGAGAIESLNLGENAKALFISRGLVEMVHIGKALGVKPEIFFGVAGVGDLIATCNSPNSRNFQFGFRLGKGESANDIIASMDEVAEGIRTIDIVRRLAFTLKVKVPITEIIDRIIKREITVAEAHVFFMKFPFRTEIIF